MGAKKQKSPIPVRLTPENEVRLEEIVKRSNLQNRNKVINRIIEDYHTFEKNRELLNAVVRLKSLLRDNEDI